MRGREKKKKRVEKEREGKKPVLGKMGREKDGKSCTDRNR